MIYDISFESLSLMLLLTIIFNVPVLILSVLEQKIRKNVFLWLLWLMSTSAVWLAVLIIQAKLSHAGMGDEHYKSVHRNIFTVFALAEFALGGAIVVAALRRQSRRQAR